MQSLHKIIHTQFMPDFLVWKTRLSTDDNGNNNNKHWQKLLTFDQIMKLFVYILLLLGTIKLCDSGGAIGALEKLDSNTKNRWHIIKIKVLNFKVWL